MREYGVNYKIDLLFCDLLSKTSLPILVFHKSFSSIKYYLVNTKYTLHQHSFDDVVNCTYVRC